MKYEVEIAITILANKGNMADDSADALRFTQAALNLAHVLATCTQTEIQLGQVLYERP